MKLDVFSLTLNAELPDPVAAVVENLTVARQSPIIFMKKNRRLASYRALPFTLSLYRPIVAFHCLSDSPARLNSSSLRQLKHSCISQFHLRPAPSPPRAPPGISIFFALDGKISGLGTLELSNPPGWGRKKMLNAPSSVNSATFFIDRTVKKCRFKHFSVRFFGLINHIAEHHLQKKHQIDWDSATCITYSTDYYQRLTLESWFTTDYRTGCRNVSHCQQQHVLFRTTFTRTIKLNLLLKWLLGSNLSQDYKYCSEE